jgi:hypothetical protein
MLEIILPRRVRLKGRALGALDPQPLPISTLSQMQIESMKRYRAGDAMKMSSSGSI